MLVGQLDVLDLVGGEGGDLGQFFIHAHGLVGRDAPGHDRFDIGGVEVHDVVVLCVLVRSHGFPVGHGLLELVRSGGVLAALDVIKGGLVGIHVAHARPALDGHVAYRHALFHAHGVEDRPAVLVGVANAALYAQFLDDVKRHVLGGDAGFQHAVHVHAAHLQGVHGQALGGQNVPDLGGADAEGQRAEGSVGGGVGVAAGDGHAGLGQAHFRADDMNDALQARVEPEEGDAEFLHVFLDGAHHLLGLVVGEGPGLALGGHDVVHGGEGAVGIGHLQALFRHHVEGLGAGDLVDEVQADEKLVLAGRQFVHYVLIPDFVVQGSFAHFKTSSI